MQAGSLKSVYSAVASCPSSPLPLVQRILEHAVRTKDASLLTLIARRSDLPDSMHNAIVKSRAPKALAARLRFMTVKDIDTLAKPGASVQVLSAIGALPELSVKTRECLLNSTARPVHVALAYNEHLPKDIRVRAVENLTATLIKSSQRTVATYAQVLLGLPGFGDAVALTISKRDPLLRNALATAILSDLSISASARSELTKNLLRELAAMLALNKVVNTVNVDSLKPVRRAIHVLSSILTQPHTQLGGQEALTVMNKILSDGISPTCALPLVKSERDYLVKCFTNLVSSCPPVSATPDTSFALDALNAKSPSQAHALISARTSPLKPAEALAILSSDHVTSDLLVLLNQTYSPAQQAYIKKALRKRPIVSSAAIAVLCASGANSLNVSCAYIDDLLSAHTNPSIVLSDILVVLAKHKQSQGATSHASRSTLNLMSSKYYFATTTADTVPLTLLPPNLSPVALSQIVSALSTYTSNDALWETLSLTAQFPETSLQEALVSASLLC